MSKKYNLKECKMLLHSILANAMFHMYEIEKQVAALGLKMDGTDSEENLRKGRVFTLVLTILNDSLHSAHGYMSTIFDKKTMERFIKNQKIAFDNKLVNPCNCGDCAQRGYKYEISQSSVDMERGDQPSQRQEDIAQNEGQA